MKQKKGSDIGLAPVSLADNEVIAKVLQNRGNLFDVLVPASHWPRAVEILKLGDSDSTQLLVGLSPQLRNKFFVRRNGFVVLSLEDLGPSSKIKGEITNVVGDQRDWQKTLREEWPAEFSASREETQMELPPSLSEDEDTSEEE